MFFKKCADIMYKQMDENKTSDANQKVKFLPKIDLHDVFELWDELRRTYLRINHSRKNSGSGRTQVFGWINKRGKGPGPAANNLKYPELYKKLCNFGEILKQKFAQNDFDFQYDGIQLNHNYESLKHIDKNNVGESVLVSFGEYEGGELVVEDVIYDTRLQPILFDGSKYYHWNKPIVNGNKYSLVFFKNNKVQDLKKSIL